MEKEAIVQIYKKIYFVKKNNVIETVYKYQEVLTGIIVTLDNGNKVFKDSNNNIFPCLNNDTLIHPNKGFAYPVYVKNMSISERKALIRRISKDTKKYSLNYDIKLIGIGRNLESTVQINKKIYPTDIELFHSYKNVISKLKGDENVEMVALEEGKTKKVIYADELYNEVIKVVKCQDDQIRRITTAISQNQRIANPVMKTTLLVCGPAGCGKTEIFRQIRNHSDLPVIIEDATEYSITSFKGKDVTDILAHLYIEAGRDIDKAQHGIVVIDEIDKKISSNEQHYTYARGVMDSLLKMAEGHTYELDERTPGIRIPIKFDTSKVTFAFLGACDGIEELTENNKSMGFNANIYPSSNNNEIYTKDTLHKYGFGHEFLRRCTLCPLKKLEEKDLIEILNTSDFSILKLYKEFYESIGINFIYDIKTIEAIAKKANTNSYGASELKVILEMALEIANFFINSSEQYKELIIDQNTINNPHEFILRK